MNAIILAAGMGQRMETLTRINNKVLLMMDGMSLMERMLHYLHDAGIYDITIVSGYGEDGLMPLVKKYGIRLIHNKKYSYYNNIYSLELAFENWNDTFLIHGDVALFKNVFLEKSEHTYFLSVLKNPRGSKIHHPVINKHRQILQVVSRKEDERITTFLGISSWKQKDAEYVKMYMRSHVNEKMRKAYHGSWEDIVYPLLSDMDVEVHQLDSKYGADINVRDDYFRMICVHEEEKQKMQVKS